MDFEYIEQLLERYWQGETTLEEEATLRTFFSGDQVPRNLLRYKDLFVYQQLQQEEGLGDDFDARILSAIEEKPVVVETRRLTWITRLMPLFRAAAVVAIMLSAGNFVQHSFYTDVEEVVATDTIGKQISAPSVAFSGDLSTTHEQQFMDSLNHTDESLEQNE